jgi:hypothetical protein
MDSILGILQEGRNLCEAGYPGSIPGLVLPEKGGLKKLTPSRG